ncbi:hypothetical protein SND84_10085 [Escherichia coli]|uniref:hypothetical protein n=1 Tax=Enterobacteriaceae TaxID=543 RepID=UPI0011ECB582|nr:MULTISPECIES: hypothetical protein [Enterobacteriaceae]EHP1068086.1 hypothetical protein [Escherichia coli]ELF2505686.1 hypothetical protein [Escherichia coli]MBL4121714.1 hypothetical protein [Escherichia coli]MCK3248609.1 hypothetical protein [Escherichia coli]MCK3516670.1 hypothetical protein [Escherichia coli]
MRHHISDRWGVMYVERWLKAPVQMLDRSIQKRTRGTPQGGHQFVTGQSILAYAFDIWMQRHHGEVPFEWYTDDAVCHCHSCAQARALMEQLRERFAQWVLLWGVIINFVTKKKQVLIHYRGSLLLYHQFWYPEMFLLFLLLFIT